MRIKLASLEYHREDITNFANLQIGQLFHGDRWDISGECVGTKISDTHAIRAVNGGEQTTPEPYNQYSQVRPLEVLLD